MPRLIVHDRAKADLDEIADYIALDSIDAALRFYAAAQSAFNCLADFPGAGAPHPTGNPLFDTLRIWPITGFRNYLVCYLPLADGAEVLRVIHAARDVNRVFR
jgi:plasmid stabilization system protein ParE